ncbi:MAG TPA: ATP-binding cassette domain-containing protein [Oligoflexia bacterium]|nr:ATP-binding cassette domain-containing protein [Oligoflexia bacterium]HMP47501.1 ATP-binding cassette domain-containing protein [Oligoflexia bacterium]
MVKSRPLISISKLTKNFDGISAVSEVSFDIYSSQVVGLVGDNGAGKSTLVKMLSGVLEPSSGSIFCDGELIQIESPATAREMGIEMVHQDLALCGNLNASENIFLGREMRYFDSLWAPLKKEKMKERSESLLEILQSDSSASQLVQTMSGGQRQAVAIARTLLSNARLVIMDEPLAAISVRQIEEVLSLMKRLRDEGKAVLLITHRIDDVFSVCDRVIVMRRGTKVADQEIDKLTANELTGLITGAI